jgi:hypothetical protein
MADFVMLAERPGAANGPPVARTEPSYQSVSSLPAFAEAPSQAIGNYKGVMLCNRPGVEPESAAPHGGASDSAIGIFRTGIPRETLHPKGRGDFIDIVDVSTKPCISRVRSCAC